MRTGSLSQAFYRHPAFLPHRLLKNLGISNIWISNSIFTAFCAAGLTLASWLDNSMLLAQRGYGYFEHPGIFGWYAVQMLIPIAIYKLAAQAVRSRYGYRKLLYSESRFDFESELFRPMIDFIALKTTLSRSYFILLFTLWFCGFAWNTWQNLLPNIVIPLDFWDSKNFIYGYAGTRLYKFYTHVLLMPSIFHIFSGIVWHNIQALRSMLLRGNIRIIPFSPDRCGGLGFISDLILAPATIALLMSGIAFFGTAYTHKQISVSTVQGISAVLSILIFFYFIPTFFLRSIIKRMKNEEIHRIYRSQEQYYKKILSGRTRGEALRNAHDYLRYFGDVIERIDKIPNWPHIAKIFGIFGIVLTRSLVTQIVSAIGALAKIPILSVPH